MDKLEESNKRRKTKNLLAKTGDDIAEGNNLANFAKCCQMLPNVATCCKCWQYSSATLLEGGRARGVAIL